MKRRTLINGGVLLLPLAVAPFISLWAAGLPILDNTATGTGALQSVVTGKGNTADGYSALGDTTGGSYNTAVGSDALLDNTTGSRNTAVGANSLLDNRGSDNSGFGYDALASAGNGARNTAFGSSALSANVQGHDNTADGFDALTANLTGSYNTAAGASALATNTYGAYNTAYGYDTMEDSDIGSSNTAYGAGALRGNTNGSFNTGVGMYAIVNNRHGSMNTGIGLGSLESQQFEGSGNTAIVGGSNATTATNSIYINSDGSSSDGSVIDIGTQGTQTVTVIAGIYGEAAANGAAVTINSDGQLGTVVSSARFKDDIRDMGDASSELFSLRPVEFRYKPEIDPKGIAQFGLVAEEVEKIDPALVVHDPDGKPYSVRYEQVNAMLLNEFLKQHKEVCERRAKVAALEAAEARQQSEMAASDAQYEKDVDAAVARRRDKIASLKAALKEQGALLQKVATGVAPGSPKLHNAVDSQ